MEPAPPTTHFLGIVAGASLKLTTAGLGGLIYNNFLGIVAGASLKPLAIVGLATVAVLISSALLPGPH